MGYVYYVNLAHCNFITCLISDITFPPTSLSHADATQCITFSFSDSVYQAVSPVYVDTLTLEVDNSVERVTVSGSTHLYVNDDDGLFMPLPVIFI